MPEDMPRAEPRPEQLLGELEAAIMQVIWREDEVTVRDVVEALRPQRRIAYTTVMTVMGRLVRKGLLTTRKQGKALWYRPTATAEEFVAQRAHQAVQNVLANFGDAALAYFLRELEDVDPVRLATLRELAQKSSRKEPHDAF